MRTLEQIRNDNKKYDLLIIGMEDAPFDIPQCLKKNELEIYNNFVKPISKRVFSRNNTLNY